MTRLIFSRLRAGAGALALALALPACTDDSPTGVEREAVVLDAITRYEPLAEDVTVSATIGKEGGTLTIPEAGLTVEVPPGAVGKPVLFTATARKGAIVAYDFGPSGRFAVPIEVKQDLYYTSWHHQEDLTDVFGGFFRGEGALNDAESKAAVSEVPPSAVNIEECELTFSVSHFSGYVIATGRSRLQGQR